MFTYAQGQNFAWQSRSDRSIVESQQRKKEKPLANHPLVRPSYDSLPTTYPQKLGSKDSIHDESRIEHGQQS